MPQGELGLPLLLSEQVGCLLVGCYLGSLEVLVIRIIVVLWAYVRYRVILWLRAGFPRLVLDPQILLRALSFQRNDSMAFNWREKQGFLIFYITFELNTNLVLSWVEERSLIVYDLISTSTTSSSTAPTAFQGYLILFHSLVLQAVDSFSGIVRMTYSRLRFIGIGTVMVVKAGKITVLGYHNLGTTSAEHPALQNWILKKSTFSSLLQGRRMHRVNIPNLPRRRSLGHRCCGLGPACPIDRSWWVCLSSCLFLRAAVDGLGAFILCEGSCMLEYDSLILHRWKSHLLLRFSFSKSPFWTSANTSFSHRFLRLKVLLVL